MNHDIEPLSEAAEEGFGQALQGVLGDILARAEAERKKNQPWNDLFNASEQGLAGIINNAELQMIGIALSTADVIKQKFGLANVSEKLWLLIKALPFAMNA